MKMHTHTNITYNKAKCLMNFQNFSLLFDFAKYILFLRLFLRKFYLNGKNALGYFIIVNISQEL